MRSRAAEEQNGARELNWFQPSERDDFVSDSQLVEELGGRVVSQMDASMRRLIESTFVEGHATGCEVGGVGHRRIEDSAVVVADVTQDPMRTECGFEPRFPRGDRVWGGASQGTVPLLHTLVTGAAVLLMWFPDKEQQSPTTD